MKEQYGHYESVEQINQAAEGFKNEGDEESLKGLAKQCGIDEMYADCYMSGEIPVLCDLEVAAIGKLDVEVADYGKQWKPLAEEIADGIKECISKEQVSIIMSWKGIELDVRASAEDLEKKIIKKNLTEIIKKDVMETVKKVQGKGGYVSQKILTGIAIEGYMK